MKTYVHNEMGTRIFIIAASFVVAPNSKENVHQLVNSYIAVHLYHGIVLSHRKNNL